MIVSVLRDVSQMHRVYAACQQLATLGIRVFGAVVNGMPIKIVRQAATSTRAQATSRVQALANLRLPCELARCEPHGTARALDEDDRRHGTCNASLVIASACVVLVASGVVHGLWTDRWSDLADLCRRAPSGSSTAA